MRVPGCAISSQRRHGHDTREDGDGDSGDFAAFAEIVKVTVLEKQLRDDVIRAGVHLGFEEIHFEGAVWGGGVSLGEASDADAEAAGVGVVGETADEFDKIGGVLKGVFGAVIGDGPDGRITAEGEDI